MKSIVLAAVVTALLLSSCSKYSVFVQDQQDGMRDGWDWIVVSDSGDRPEAAKIVQLLRETAYRVEWFKTPKSFQMRDPKREGRLSGMRSILLIGDAVKLLSELKTGPRELVLILPVGTPISLQPDARPWRGELILEPNQVVASGKPWADWAAEQKIGVTVCAAERVNARETWQHIFADMDDAVKPVHPNG